jgi:hypothetical protein
VLTASFINDAVHLTRQAFVSRNLVIASFIQKLL